MKSNVVFGPASIGGPVRFESNPTKIENSFRQLVDCALGTRTHERVSKSINAPNETRFNYVCFISKYKILLRFRFLFDGDDSSEAASTNISFWVQPGLLGCPPASWPTRPNVARFSRFSGFSIKILFNFSLYSQIKPIERNQSSQLSTKSHLIQAIESELCLLAAPQIANVARQERKNLGKSISAAQTIDSFRNRLLCPQTMTIRASNTHHIIALNVIRGSDKVSQLIGLALPMPVRPSIVAHQQKTIRQSIISKSSTSTLQTISNRKQPSPLTCRNSYELQCSKLF